MADTTITYLSEAAPLVAYGSSSPATLTTGQTTLADSQTVAIQSHGFALYVPILLENTAIPIIQLMLGLNSTASSPAPTPPTWAWYGVGSGVLTSTSKEINFTAIEATTLFVPYTGDLPATVTASVLVNNLRAALQPTSTSAASPETTQTSSAAAAGSSNNSPGSISTTSSAALASTSSGSNSTRPSATDTSNPNTSIGALAGGVVGAFICGIILALLAAWLVFRRKKSRSDRTAFDGSKGSSSRTPSGEGIRATEEVLIPMNRMSGTGWEKHLPQEKDDRTISGAVKSVFEQAQIHIEGFYSPAPGKAPDGTMQTIETFAEDDLSTSLPEARNPLPLLEGILVRFIVHKISLRCSAQESLLPQDYINLPAKSKWHMESNEREKHSQEVSDEAFSKWRVLTSFLEPDARDDSEFRRSLNAVIDAAVRDLTAAFAPWAEAGKNEANRKESLSQILYQASDVGILLFKQPFVFLFDWVDHGGDHGSRTVIAPGLTRRSGSGEHHTLLQAKRLSMK